MKKFVIFTDSAADLPKSMVKDLDINYLGSEEDVLDRYTKAASKFNADIVVRATSLENLEAYGELKVVKSGFTSVGTIPGTDGCLSVSREGDILWITGLPVETDCLFRVTDLSGRVVQTVSHRGDGRFHLSIGQLPAGVYVLQVVARDVQGTFRFIR